MPLALAVLALLMAASSSSQAMAEDCRWGQGVGRVAADVLSTAEARQLALRQARSAAIVDALGVEVKSATLVRDYMLAADFVRTLVMGYVTREQVVKWDQERYQPTPKNSPIPILRVTLRACVLPVAKKRDPGFTLTAKLDKVVYTPGDKARLEVHSTRPAHVTIFNLTDDDHIRLYGGPAMGLPLQVLPGVPGRFPPPGVSLVMELPPGQVRASEAFILVATKAADRIQLPLTGNPEAILSLADFYHRLSVVQADIIEEIVPYAITGR
ncbi:MAG: hypothetical protein AB7G48_07415 [Nitrospiraceae bacterium]